VLPDQLVRPGVLIDLRFHCFIELGILLLDLFSDVADLGLCS
jgi:hypothetical protein